MTIPKKYLHDRLVLLLLGVQTFLALLITLWVLLKLDGGRASGYIVQYRSPLGIGALKTGGASELAAFVGFALVVIGVHTLLSKRVYTIKRQLSVIILSLGILLLVLAFIASNALLVLG